MKITFWGATETVTGSRFIVETGSHRLLVDCGLFQGVKALLRHLRTVAPDHRSTIALVGYQAAGTRGEALLAGARRIKIFGDYIPVRADIVRLDNLSAHADANELTDWLGKIPKPPKRAFIVHCEPSAADASRRSLHDDLGWNTHVPIHGETVELT